MPVLSYEFCKIFKNNFLQNISARLLLDFFHSLSCFFATQLTNRSQVFSIFEHVLSQLLNVIIIIISNIMNFQFTLLCETDDPVVAAGKQFLLQAFLSDNRNYLSNFLTFIIYWISVPHCPVNSSLKSQRSSWGCDSLIKRCFLNKLFLNISQY